MSVGGYVLQTRELSDRIDIDVFDPPSGPESTVGVAICDDSRAIKPGDQVWWQLRTLYWTPEPTRHFTDRKIERVGYSRQIAGLSGS